ncbi:MAG: aromatic amino acid lyase, partial [Sciscionella sp.]|nr:aromatic amino acid lyase [Sciscionella sp.]
MAEPISIGLDPLTRDEVIAVARERAPVTLTTRALDAVAAARAHIDKLAHAPTPTYGVSTGFGALATKHIPTDRRAALQRSLIRSHAAGAGDPVEVEVVRALMLLRLRTLASGHTGVQPSTVDTLARMLNAGLTPP